MLANATGQNVANQAALMASQRGAGANAGLIARQAAQQGAQTQQQSAGQAAALQAQQSLNAIQGAGALANQQVAQQQQATSGMTNAQLQSQSNLLNSIAGQNQANVQMQSNVNNANAGLAGGVMGQQGQLFGNIMGGIGSGMMLAEGGEINPGMVREPSGGSADNIDPTSFVSRYFGNDNSLGKGAGELGKGLGSAASKAMAPTQGAAAGPTMSNLPGMMRPMAGFAQGGKVPAMVSPGEKYLAPQDVEKVKQGANPMQVGETIPGKPKVSGAQNSYANDTVKKDLDQGGIVLPRSVTQSTEAVKKADAFVRAILAKHNARLPKKSK